VGHSQWWKEEGVQQNRLGAALHRATNILNQGKPEGPNRRIPRETPVTRYIEHSQ
jgi:hypothetical protein